MAYATKYTISTLSGAYAEKYAVLCRNAQWLDALLNQNPIGKGIEDLASRDAAGKHFDAYEIFMRLMKVAQWVARIKPKSPFYTGIAKVEDGKTETAVSFTDEDEKGPFTITAIGNKVQIERAGEEEEWDGDIKGKNAEYKAQSDTVSSLFYEDLRNLLNLCEESLAKNASIILHVVGNDAPTPPPLFHLELE